MFLKELTTATKICLWADVVPDIQGHRGIGKTDMVRQIGMGWVDPYTEYKGLPVTVLYCATQEVTDLIGFPTKVWESTGKPVVEGIAPDDPNDRIITSWAPPDWLTKLHQHCAQFEEEDRKTLEEMKANGASEDEIWLFWNRPKCIVFLDESKRAQRDVMQAMYPLILSKTLHTNELPRGARIITADNYTGAYDVREPDEAFMSRFCHLEAEAHIASWYEWALTHNMHGKISNFLTKNPTFLLQVPEDQKDAVVKYVASPDPRRWELVSRVEKFGRKAVEQTDAETANSIIKQVLQGLIGIAAAEQYWAFTDNTISLEDILSGKKKLAKVFEKIKSQNEKNRLKEKLQLEVETTLRNRPYNKKEGEHFKQFILDMDAKERATAILQTVFVLKNNDTLDPRWISGHLLQGSEITELIQHLMDQKNLSV